MLWGVIVLMYDVAAEPDPKQWEKGKVEIICISMHDYAWLHNNGVTWQIIIAACNLMIFGFICSYFFLLTSLQTCRFGEHPLTVTFLQGEKDSHAVGGSLPGFYKCSKTSLQVTTLNDCDALSSFTLQLLSWLWSGFFSPALEEAKDICCWGPCNVSLRRWRAQSFLRWSVRSSLWCTQFAVGKLQILQHPSAPNCSAAGDL